MTFATDATPVSNVIQLADAARAHRRSAPAGAQRDPTRLPSGSSADADIDALAQQFLGSRYSSDDYADWPLDRRLEGFLQHRGLGHLADNGDTFTIISDCVMSYISCQRVRGGASGSAQSAHR